MNTQLSGVQHRKSETMLNPCGDYRHSVERLLDSVDAVVYILDYTKLKTQEEAELLTKLSKSNPQLIMRLAQRLFFVVNKIDVMHVSEGLDEDELREYVADVVTKQMNFTTFQLRPEQVCTLSFLPFRHSAKHVFFSILCIHRYSFDLLANLRYVAFRLCVMCSQICKQITFYRRP